MASAGPQPTPQQMAALQQQMMEAQKRGMTPQQFQAMQRKKIEEEAAKHGMTFDQYINKMKQDALASHQRQQQMLAQQQQQQSGQPGPQQGQEVPITPGAPDPKALAVAKWLRSQDLKTRTCILNGQRRDMFRVKRAIRAIESPEYTAAQKKNPLLPTPPATKAAANEVFKLLPLSLLALRVTKIDPHTGHGHGKTKRVKGLWTVKIEQQQDISDDLHYVWLYDGPQWRTKLYAAGAVLCIFAVVLFPLWPLFMRVGVWYLSMAFLGLLGLFFAMSIFRLILFCITVVTMPKGLWLYPNLFEDVGFFDSFRPVWAWQEEKGKKGSKTNKSKSDSSGGSSKKKSKKSSTSTATNTTTTAIEGNGSASAPVTAPATAAATANDASPAAANAGAHLTKRVPAAHVAPRVEEVEDE